MCTYLVFELRSNFFLKEILIFSPIALLIGILGKLMHVANKLTFGFFQFIFFKLLPMSVLIDNLAPSIHYL